MNGVKYWMDVVRTTPMLFWICCMVSCTSLSVFTSSILEKIPLNMAPKSSLATELSLYKRKKGIACICVLDLYVWQISFCGVQYLHELQPVEGYDVGVLDLYVWLISFLGGGYVTY